MPSKPEDSRYIAWVDLECTGNKPDSQVLEVGLVITARNLDLVYQRNFIIKPSEVWEWQMDDFVKQMHTENGLIRDVKMKGQPREAVDRELATFMYALDDGNHIPFAGSGVSHYDRRYIQKDLPLFDARLSYWALDVGVLRRTLKVICGITVPKAELKEAKTHRALDDILVHIEEMRAYKEYLRDRTSG